MRLALGVSRRGGRLLRGGVMLIAGALGLGSCDSTGGIPPYGMPPDSGAQACASDELCRDALGTDWYCEMLGNGVDAGTCAPDHRKDGGGGD